jgi:hypothetical protein
VKEQQAGLASGLLNTSQQLGGSIGIAIASSVAASHTQTLLHAGHAAPAALTGEFQQALWVLGGIGLLAIPAIFALVRREAVSTAAAKTSVRDPNRRSPPRANQPHNPSLTPKHKPAIGENHAQDHQFRVRLARRCHRRPGILGDLRP